MHRYKIYVLFALLLTCISLEAQRFEASAVAGFNFSQLDGDNLAGYNKAGIVAGAKVAAILKPKWRLSMELLYSQRGSRRGVREASAYDKFALNYVEIPVMAYLTDWKVEFGAGLSYSRLFNYNIIDIGGQDVTDSFELKNSDLALLAEATYYVNPNFGIGLRWGRGILNINANKADRGLVGKWFTARFVYRFNVSTLAE